MPLETATYVTDLVSSNPAHTDGLSQADSHMRLLKSCIKATFPNFTSAALNSTQAEVDAVAHTKQFSAQNGANTTPSHTFSSDLTAGFYKGTRTGQTAISGTLRGAGAMPPAALVHFAVAPPSMGSAAINTGCEWLQCNGVIYNVADYPDLGALLGSLYGGNGTTTFGVPNLTDTGRFLRSYTNPSVSIAVYQSNQNLQHTHVAATTAAGSHSHVATVTDPGHNHTYGSESVHSNGGGSSFQSASSSSGTQPTGTSSTGISVSNDTAPDHTHGVAVNNQGGSEARPEAMTCYICIKT